MKQKLALLMTAIAMVAALAFGLVGCGGGASAEDAKNFVGDWTVTDLQAGDETDSLSSALQLLDSLGMKVTLTLSEDGNAALDMAGQQSMKGTWEAKDATTCTLSFEGTEPVDATLAGDKLMIAQSNMSMAFERAKAEAQDGAAAES